MRMTWQRLVAGSVFMALGGAQVAPAQDVPEVEIGVTASEVQLMRIEVENFDLPGLPGDAPVWMRALDDILVQDLQYSDLFRITRWFLYPGDPAHPTSRALIRGSVEPTSAGYVLRGRVEELPGRKLVFQKAYTFPMARARQVAHRFADEVVEHLTGHVGISRTRIVFAKANGRAKELWIVDYDGENLQQLTKNRSLNISPGWSPDGNEVVYTTFVRQKPELAVLTVGSGATRILTSSGQMNSAGAWSPDGRRIAFARSLNGVADIWVVDADGTGMRPLTQSKGIDTSPTWAPTGRQIAFISDRSGNPQIYVMNADGGGARRVTFAGSYNDSPRWSPRPNGTEIAFVSRDGNVQNVYVMSPTGDKMRPVVFGRGDCENPTWAPDGRHIVYSVLRGEERGIYIRDLDTGRERRLTTGPGDCYGPAWSPVPTNEFGW